MNAVTVVCQPENDRPFRAFVELQLRELPPNATGADLESRLRMVYRNAVVRPSSRLGSIAGGQSVRYAYRDGEDSTHRDEEWWRDPAVARIAFDAGRICCEANEAAVELLGRASPGDVLGRGWTEFIPRDSVEASVRLWDELGETLVIETDAIESTHSVARPDGTSVSIEYRTFWDAEAGLYRVSLRRRPVRVDEEAVALR